VCARRSRDGMQQAEFPRIGELFVGRYEIQSVIGTGGFSQVYRARQTDLGREVAIKVLKPVTDPKKSEAEREKKFDHVSRRFEREARLISRLKDRNTVVMYDYGSTDDGLLYMVLEYVAGITISELLQTSGPLAPERVVKIVRQALTSLHEAHMLGVLHRDIKPGNIMVYEHVGRADQVKVLDFGIAKTVDRADGSNLTTSSDVTADGVLVGTPRYMSPEQIRGKKLGAGSDIYSLGLVAYEMLMGMKAVDADSSLRIIARHLDTDPIGLPSAMTVPRRLRSIINKMLLKDPADRYASCEEVLHDLETWDHEPQLPGPTDPTTTTDASIADEVVEPPAPSSSSTRWLGIGITVLILAIVAMTVPWLLREPDDAVADTASEEKTSPTERLANEGSVATVATVDSPTEPDDAPGDEPTDEESAAAADVAARSIESARVAAESNQAEPSTDTSADTPEESEERVAEAKVEKKPPKRRRSKRKRRPKKNRQKKTKPSKVEPDSKDGDLKIFGIE
jgi:serine/threonine-protein kinase